VLGLKKGLKLDIAPTEKFRVGFGKSKPGKKKSRNRVRCDIQKRTRTLKSKDTKINEGPGEWRLPDFIRGFEDPLR